MLNYRLLTPYSEGLDRGLPLPEYPRPQLVRDSFFNLNGEWDYAFTRSDGQSSAQGRIIVPFSPESCLSGVLKTPEKGEKIRYFRDFELPENFIREKTLLHIGAVDQVCEVFVNGVSVGEHSGGYLPADFDISEAIRAGKNTIEVLVTDELSFDLPTGKQRKKRGGIWYTPISGIWQTVWLESVNNGFIQSLKITPDIDKSCVNIEIDSRNSDFCVVVSADGKEVCREDFTGKSVTLKIPEMRLWSPEQPFLYDLRVSTEGDSVKSYFAMRKFTADGRHFLLNNRPYFVNGVLDQGYFSDGIYTPASYDAYRDDITAMKALGYNTLRKHIKVEPLMFYSLCDRLGMLVLQDMVNVGRYSFFKDTILPFAGLRRGLPYVSVSKKQRLAFTKHAEAEIAHLYNSPCVVCYTIFNEGWGQFDGDGMYEKLKSLDPTRVYDATSGWFREKNSDVASEHIYFKPIRLKTESRALIVSEFGGYSHNSEGHVFNTGKSFGYRKYDSLGELEDAVFALYEKEILPAAEQGLAGAIYTQLSDVEDETNGILTYDRRVCKLDPTRFLPLMLRIKECAER